LRPVGYPAGSPRWAVSNRVLVIGHSATHLALEVTANGERLEELVGAPFTWQPGWEYVLD